MEKIWKEESDEYFKNLKEAEKYKDKKKTNENKNLDPDMKDIAQYVKSFAEEQKFKAEMKTNENKYSEPIINELAQYVKSLSEEQKLKAKNAAKDKKEPTGIVYDFIKITNHTLEDISKSLNKAANKLIDDMSDSIYKSGNKLTEDLTKAIYSLKKPKENKIEVSKEVNIVKEKEVIKEELKTVDIKKELENAKKIDKQLYKDLEAIDRITNREMQHLNNTYKQYNDLINMANECNLHLGYEQRMSGIKAYGESKRSIEDYQAELVSIAKGQTKEQQAFKSSEKAMDYIDRAEKKIEELKGQNKLLDIKGNMERNQVIKDIKREIEIQKQVLKDNGINTKEDFNKLKDEVLRTENSFKRSIEFEKTRYKEEMKEQRKEEKLLKQMENKTDKKLDTNVKENQNTRGKKVQLER